MEQKQNKKLQELLTANFIISSQAIKHSFKNVHSIFHYSWFKT